MYSGKEGVGGYSMVGMGSAYACTVVRKEWVGTAWWGWALLIHVYSGKEGVGGVERDVVGSAYVGISIFIM
jgi:hypothetical protein